MFVLDCRRRILTKHSEAARASSPRGEEVGASFGASDKR
jgi:hypothetical protein